MKVVEREAAVAFIFSKDRHLLVGQTVRGGAYEGMWIVPGVVSKRVKLRGMT